MKFLAKNIFAEQILTQNSSQEKIAFLPLSSIATNTFHAEKVPTKEFFGAEHSDEEFFRGNFRFLRFLRLDSSTIFHRRAD
jgi:hypothetical protein